MEAPMLSPNFPSELLFDILIKLPVKTLIRFQCVSKCIRGMITDPTFISMHRDRCAANNHNSSGRYITKFMPDKKYSLYLSHVVDDGDRKLGIPETVLKLPDELLDMNITGSCHNVLCFSGRLYQAFPFNTYLWNPSIRVVKKLPDSNSLPPGIPYLCGIGFDSRTNDYKVVQIVHGYACYARPLCCRVYSVSTNSWRWIESYPHEFDLGRQGYFKQSCTYWKDSLYWIAHEFILSFNLCGEMFEIISLHEIFNSQDIVLAANLGSIKESLALFVECNYVEGTSVWVLKKELLEVGGICCSWSKLFSINVEWLCCCPLNIGVCGELLLQRYEDSDRNCLGVWDFGERKFKSLGIEIHGFVFDVYPYSESLALLNQLRS